MSADAGRPERGRRWRTAAVRLVEEVTVDVAEEEIVDI